MIRALLPLLLILMALPATLRAATFDLSDNRAAREIGEATELYIDGKLVASFHLDDRQPHVEVTLTVPGTRDPDGHEDHRYALCGTITIRNAQGMPEIHEVNSAGALHDPDGHRFEALGALNFTRFYLADPDDPQAAESMPQHSGLCHASIS